MSGDCRNWYMKHRQEWIAETLLIFGFIKRKHLMRKFGVSVQQATADIQKFLKDNPDSLKYDLSTKRYVSTTADRGDLEKTGPDDEDSLPTDDNAGSV